MTERLSTHSSQAVRAQHGHDHGPGLISGWGIKISQAVQCDQKIIIIVKYTRYNNLLVC